MSYASKLNIEFPSGDITKRFALGRIDAGKNPLIIIGLNPSKATIENPDPTMSRIEGLILKNKMDTSGFIMLNLHPERMTKPGKLAETIDSENHYSNIACIREIFEMYPAAPVLAAWGNTIRVRPYMNFCLNEIYSLPVSRSRKWLKTGEETKMKHPRHPSRGEYKFFTGFDIEAYIAKTKKDSDCTPFLSAKQGDYQVEQSGLFKQQLAALNK